MLVEGYFEEVVQRLDDPGLEELVRAADRREAEGRRGPGARVHRRARRGGLMAQRRRPSRSLDVRADFPVLGPRDQRAPARLPRLGRHLAEAAPGDRDDGRATTATPTRNVHRGVYELGREATELFEGARERIAAFVSGTRPARSSPATRPRRSTSSPTRGAANNVGPGRRGAHHARWSTTRTSCPGSCSARRRGARLRYLTSRTTGSSRSTSSTRRSPTARVKLRRRRPTCPTCSARSTRSPRSPRRARAAGAVSVIDGSQAVPQMPVDVAASARTSTPGPATRRSARRGSGCCTAAASCSRRCGRSSAAAT